MKLKENQNRRDGSGVYVEERLKRKERGAGGGGRLHRSHSAQLSDRLSSGIRLQEARRAS